MSATATRRTAAPPAAPPAPRRSTVLRRRLGPLGVPIILVALILIFQEQNSQFLTGSNIQNILQSAALPTIVACGLTVVLIVGEFDLSVQAIAGFGTTVVAVMMANHGFSLVPALAFVTLCGAAIGLFNGILVAYARLAALVVTIAVGSLLNGTEYATSHSQAVSSGISDRFMTFAQSNVGPLPTLVVVALVAAFLIWLLLERTSLGREMHAIGQNTDAARFAGVRVERTIVIAFVVSALAAVVAGELYAGHQGVVYPLEGLQILLPAFAACFIGAAMFRIGEFNIPGTIVGSLLAAVVTNGLLLANVANYTTYFFQGGILLGAILFARLVGGRGDAS